MKGQVNRPLLRSMASSHIFKIMFVNQGKVYEVYARRVSQTGSLFRLRRPPQQHHVHEQQR